MKIISLELYGYKRLKLNQTRRFIIKPENAIQLILGTNGSGKSSIMEELSPLPANPNNYSKDGHKIIEIFNNGHKYIISSRFDPKQEHSIIRDGIELNDGGTVTVQKELIKQEFGITTEIHELLIGDEKFHLMSSARKREWFTKLGESDYNYSLKVFAKLKEKHRDIIGSNKVAKKRLVVETSKLINDEEINKLKDEINELHRVLNILMENKSVCKSSKELTDQYNIIESKILNTSKEIFSIKLINIEDNKINSEIDIDFIIRDIKQSIKNIEDLIKIKVEFFNQLEKTQQAVISDGGTSIKELEAKIEPIQKKQSKIRSRQKFKLIFENPEIVLQIIDVIEPQLSSILDELPINSDKKYSKVSFDKEEILQTTLGNEKLKLEQEYNELIKKKHHLEHHRDNGATICPKCEHSWIPNFNINDFNKLLKSISELEELISTKSNLIKESTLRCEAIIDYNRKYRSYLQIIESTNLLDSFWYAIDHVNIIINNPKQIINSLNHLRQDLFLEAEYIALNKELIQLGELAKNIKDVETSNLDELNKKIELCSNEISDNTKLINNLKLSLSRYEDYKNQVSKLISLNLELSKLKDTSDTLIDNRINALKNEYILSCIRDMQSNLAIKEKILSETNIQLSIVNDLKNQIIRNEIDEEALKLLIDNLSPTNGLIAEGLFGFINSFIRQMNKLIKKSWTYTLEIIPCGMSPEGDVDLDYKFPLIVNDPSNTVPDVSKGSAGMKEIIDLSFRLIAMKYLGLSTYPVFLDEFGRTFDKEHKACSVQLIKSLIEQQSFSQVYMISHDFNQYLSIANTDICVLDPTNIVVPSIYNNHVIME